MQSDGCRGLINTIRNNTMQFHSSQFQPRTRDMHDLYCQRLGGHLKDHIATTYGIARSSILNTSRYYHVADGLPPNCMHDILEGVLSYKAKMLLMTFITKRHYFDLDVLNGRIRSFPFCDAESSKPTCISSATLCSSDKKLKQSGIPVTILNFNVKSLLHVNFSIRNVVFRAIFTIAYWRSHS